MRLLVVNPNTSASVSERLRVHVAAAVGERWTVDVATAGFGAAYIRDEPSFAIAAHAALDAYARDADSRGEPAATLVGCFGDPGLEALRTLAAGPVVGLAEASIRTAAVRGRYAIVTGGAAWAPILERVVRGLGLEAGLVRIETVAPSGAELAADRPRAVALLVDACRVAGRGADAVVLGGAGLAGLADEIRSRLGSPLVDSVEAGARALRDAAERAGPDEASAGKAGSDGFPADAIVHDGWGGLAPALLDRLSGRRG